MAQAVDEIEVDLSGIQRAAILLMYLEPGMARRLLQKMQDDEVRAVGLAMATIQHVAPQTIERIVAEFVQDLHQVSLMPKSGAEFVTDVLPELLDDDRRKDLLPMINRRVNKDFELFIANRPPASVAAFLRDEHPQTQAVAMALMGSENAATLLRFFSEDARSEVTKRMARLKRIPGELADDVIGALRRTLGRQDDHLDVGGVDKTAKVLARMRRTDNAKILEMVADDDGDLADALRRRMFLFEDLRELNNRGIQALLKEVERDDLLLAVKGATPDLLELFLSNVSSRAAVDMREELEIMGPAPKKKLRTAQERIVATAMKLVEEGTIYLPMGGDDDDDDE